MGRRVQVPALLASSGPASSRTGPNHPGEWRLFKMVGGGLVQVVTLFLGELDRWMGCRWEELARHEAFKAGLEDGGAKGGGGG